MKYVAVGKGTINGTLMEAETVAVDSVESAVARYLYAFGRIPEQVLDDDDRIVWSAKLRTEDSKP